MSDLPLPDADARAHSERVVARIRDDDRRGRRMDPVRALHGARALRAGTRLLRGRRDQARRGRRFRHGAGIDAALRTALSAQVAAILVAAERREIVELGGGSGRLAADLLAALAARDALPSRYAILEPSPDLRERQRATIARDARRRMSARVDWVDALPAAIDGAVLANEVLDAVPPHIVARRGGHVARARRRVERARQAFAWVGPCRRSARIAALAAQRFPPDGDYMSEIKPAAEALVEDVGRRLAGGAMLFIDYGFPAREYYHPQRDEGTLMCHYRHRAHADPFLWPGLTDITAHVDFTAIARAGERGGLTSPDSRRRRRSCSAAGSSTRCGDAATRRRRPTSQAAAPCRSCFAGGNGRVVQGDRVRESDGIAWPGFALADRTHRL